MELVPSRNIGGDVGHRQILENVCEEQIEALVSCSRGVYMGTTCPNLQLKLHEKTRARKKKANQKEKNLKNDEGKDTNLGNELLDAGICWEGTSYKLRIQYELHRVHIFDEGKRVRRPRRCGTRIQEGGLPLARQGEKRSATVRRSSNNLWTKG